MIFLGFHLACGHNKCPIPVASVMNRDYWRCNHHFKAIVMKHNANPLATVKTSDILITVTTNTSTPNCDSLFQCNESTIGVSKDVHLQRLGVSYTVTIRKYNKHYKRQNARLSDSVIPKINVNKKKRITTKYRYFKEYLRLIFDVHRSPKQIKKWNRLSTSVLHHEHNGSSHKNKL